MARITTGGAGGLTEAQVEALIRANRDTDLPFGALTGVEFVGELDFGDAGESPPAGKTNVGLRLLTLHLTPAQYRRIKSSLAKGNRLRIKRNGTTLLNTTITRFEEFDESASDDTLDISLDSMGSWRDTDYGAGYVVEFEDADSELWNDYVDERAEAVVEKDFASLVIDGEFTYVTTTEGQLPVAAFRIASNYVVTVRAKDAAMTTALRKNLVKGKDISFHKGASEAAAQITTDVTETAIAGSSAAQFSFTVSAHTATGTGFTNNSAGFTLEVVSPAVSAVFDNVPHGVIPFIALSGVPLGRSQFKQESGNNTMLGAANNYNWTPVPRSASNGADSQAEFDVTPSSASSKIIVLFIAGVGWLGGATGVNRGNFRLTYSTDGGTTWTEATGSERTNVIHTTGGNNFTVTCGFAHSPNTTNAVKYRVETKRTDPNDNNRNNWGLEGQFAVLFETQ